MEWNPPALGQDALLSCVTALCVWRDSHSTELQCPWPGSCDEKRNCIFASVLGRGQGEQNVLLCSEEMLLILFTYRYVKIRKNADFQL